MKKTAFAALCVCSIASAQDAPPWSVGLGWAQCFSTTTATPYGHGQVLDLALTTGRSHHVQFRALVEGFALQPNDTLVDGTSTRFDATNRGVSGFAEAVFHLSDPRRPGPYLMLGGGWSHFWVSDKNVLVSMNGPQVLGAVDHKEQGNGPSGTLGVGWRVGGGWTLEVRREWQAGTIRPGAAAMTAPGVQVWTTSANIAPAFVAFLVREQF